MRRILLLSLTMAFILGCPPHSENEEPPQDHPYYPSSLLQNGNTLYVFSSNFDLRHKHGSVLSVDLKKVDEAIEQSKDLVGPEAVTSSGFIPNFADGVVFSPKKDRLVYLSRGDISLRSIPLSSDLIACPNATSAKGQDCYTDPAATNLAQGNPYFLTLLPSGDQEIAGGIIGYPLDVAFRRSDGYGNFGQPQYFELQSFTWNTSEAKAQIDKSIALGDVLRAKLNQGSTLGPVRMNVRLSAMTISGDSLFLLAERPKDQVFGRNPAALIQVSLSDIQKASSSPLPIATYDLLAKANIDSVGGLVIRREGDKTEIFLTNQAPGFLVKLALPNQDSVDASGQLNATFLREVWTCDYSTDIKLTPDDRKVLVACDDGKILVYDSQSLASLSVDPPSGGAYGRAPVKILFDERKTTLPFRFYTANFLDGSVSIFELSDSASGQMITRKGHIFEPSPLHREGGYE